MVWLGLLALFSAPDAEAQDRGARAEDAADLGPEEKDWVKPPANRLYYTNATFLRYNPLGLINLFRLGYRRRLIAKEDSTLFGDTYAFAAVNTMLTPAYMRIGGYAEVMPIAVLRVFGQVDYVGYLGTFDQVIGWDSPDADYADSTIAELGDDGNAYGTGGWVVTFGGTLQAKVGPIAARSTLNITNYNIALNNGASYFYDQYWDRLAPNGEFMALVDTDVLYVQGKVRAGLRWTFSDDLTGADASTGFGMAQHRLGPLFAYQFQDSGPGSRFNQPTVFALAQWWLQHPYRTGEDVSQGIPLIAVGFAFNGDLLTSKD